MKDRIFLTALLCCLFLSGLAQSYEWEHLGLPGMTVLSIAVSPTDGNRIIAGTEAGLYVTPDAGGTWYNRISNNLPFPDVAYAPLADDSIFCLAAGGSYSDGLYCSGDGGNSWDVVAYYTHPRRLGFEMFDPGLMYICFGDGIIRSQDYGQTYTPSNNGLPDVDIRDVMGDGGHSLEAYAVGTNFLAHTLNFANTWTEMNGTFDVPEHSPNRITYEPNGPETLYVACYQVVARSVNGGATWNYTTMANTEIMAIACNPLNAGEIYVGSAAGGGVLKSINAGAFFFPINNGLDNLNVHSLAVGPNNQLLAGTENGVYAVDLSTVSIDDEIQLPKSLALGQNYPNPFNAQTLIEFKLGDAGHGEIEIFDITGGLVKTFYVNHGSTNLIWNATDNDGVAVSSGVYFYRLTAGNETMYRRMTFLK